jgi:hypothetical protein
MEIGDVVVYHEILVIPFHLNLRLVAMPQSNRKTPPMQPSPRGASLLPGIFLQTDNPIENNLLFRTIRVHRLQIISDSSSSCLNVLTIYATRVA